MYYIVTSAIFGALLFYVPGELRREGSSVDDIWGAWFIAMAVLADTEVGAGIDGPKQAVYLAEGILQLLSLALIIGVVVDRVTAPHARILFSRIVLLTTYQGQPAISFRLVRERKGLLLENEMRVFCFVKCV